MSEVMCPNCKSSNLTFMIVESVVKCNSCNALLPSGVYPKEQWFDQQKSTVAIIDQEKKGRQGMSDQDELNAEAQLDASIEIQRLECELAASQEEIELLMKIAKEAKIAWDKQHLALEACRLKNLLTDLIDFQNRKDGKG